MSQATAQLALTFILLLAAVVFTILERDQIAVALVGAVLGQGAAVGVSRAANGNGGTK